MTLQSAFQAAVNAPSFWPITLAVAVLTAISTAWTLLGRISDRFNKALDTKLAPLVKTLTDQGEQLQKEAVRLESHFDEAIHTHELQWRKEITDIANALRKEFKVGMDMQSELRMNVRENRTLVDGHAQQLQESRMDRLQLRRDVDNVSRSLESFERNQENNKDKIMGAIETSSSKITTGQNEFSTRLTRVEEALKFYAKVRTDQA